MKYEVLMEVEKDSRSKKQIADHYGLAQSTLSTWLKKADGIKNAFSNGDFSTKRKKLPTAGDPEVEEALLKWFKTARDHNIPLSGLFMMQGAGELAEKLGVPAGGWLDRFKDRYGISFKRICGEENSVDTGSEQMEELHRTVSMILKEYDHKYVYNADEKGVFFRCLPNKTLEFKDKDCHGGKQNEENNRHGVCKHVRHRQASPAGPGQVCEAQGFKQCQVVPNRV